MGHRKIEHLMLFVSECFLLALWPISSHIDNLKVLVCFELQGHSSTGSRTDNGCHASEGEQILLFAEFIVFNIKSVQMLREIMSLVSTKEFPAV